MTLNQQLQVRQWLEHPSAPLVRQCLRNRLAHLQAKAGEETFRNADEQREEELVNIKKEQRALENFLQMLVWLASPEAELGRYEFGVVDL